MDPDTIRDGDRVAHGGESDPSILDFSANVNPRSPDGARAVYEGALDASRRYPDDEYPAYRKAAAEYVDCSPAAVIPTSGGLAAIRLTCEVTLEPGDRALVPYPSFGEYAREVRLQGGTPRFVSHDEMLEGGVERETLEECALAIVCTPNNPTGKVLDPAKLAAFADRCRGCGTTVLVDEAFLGFTDEPSLAIRNFENRVVVRSLTKLFGLPGLRAGFAVADGDLRDALATARPVWNVGTPAAQVGVHCMRDDAFVRETRDRVARERDRLREALTDRFDVFPSDAPFLLLEVRDREVSDVVTTARERGVAIRDATTFRGLNSHVRVAVKEREANDRLLEVLLND